MREPLVQPQIDPTLNVAMWSRRMLENENPASRIWYRGPIGNTTSGSLFFLMKKEGGDNSNITMLLCNVRIFYI